MLILQKVFNRLNLYYKNILRERLKEKFMHTYIHTSINYNINVTNKKILVIGIYLTDYENMAIHLFEQYSKAKKNNVEQRWVAIGKNEIPNSLKPVTIFHSQEKIPKFKLLNKILKDIDFNEYDYILFSDDDIAIHDNFLDLYIDIIESKNLKIAQPARAWHSYNVHPIVIQDKFSMARETNFVEIGPIFSFHKSVFAYLLPFPDNAEMGLGLDFVWPVIAQKNNFKIGIVDLTPVDHSYRAQSTTYSSSKNLEKMNDFLSYNENNALKTKVALKKYRK
ncbi:hypothetical protein A9Z64_09200 [Moraxella osloensis]|uniref:Protein of uncharacterized function (DUF707) n=1 Tax=Faucicola osloensis TaxID=34062 RepID=A0A378QA03_FAUOS|nr:hypothetical protein [Moraxella osloensis]AME00679.1 hypothetical protein AXE82_01910 [Moraxella osloensis]OBX54936.1 hypothetical protein A9Z64_09200 [Moraxella osloensis]QPT41729.1 hypothetical protein I6G27_06930 [Moraxella osloensis]STY97306.1 Protein of uncharacterised function (DUF707) [Moraxella osloensis]